MKKDLSNASTIRDSRIELLRIVAIFIIVLHHLILHVAIDTYSGVSFSRVISQLYIIGGKVGVNIFVIISGFFGINNKFKTQRIVKIELQVLFYTLVFLLIRFIFARDTISANTVLMAVFPTTFESYWYVTAFIGVMAFSPFINIVLKKITSAQYIVLLVVGLFMFSLAPTFLRQRNWTSELSWFIMLYIIGGSIRHFEIKLTKIRSSYWFIGGVLMTILTWGLSLVLMFLSEKKSSLNEYVNVFSTSNYSTFALVIAVCLFMCFLTMRPFKNKNVNKLAALSFGVYLIQSNPYVANVLWPFIQNLDLHYSNLWVFTAPLIAFIICVVCCLIEAVREIMMKNVCVLKKTCEKIDSCINTTEDK